MTLFRVDSSWRPASALSALFGLSTVLMLSGCHHNDLPVYSDTQESQFRNTYFKSLSDPDGALARLGDITLKQGLNRFGHGAEMDHPFENWSGDPLVLQLKGTDLTVQSVGGASVDGKPLQAGKAVPLSVPNGLHRLESNSVRLLAYSQGPDMKVMEFDTKAKALQTLHALNFYTPSPAYYVQAKWVPVDHGSEFVVQREHATAVKQPLSGYAEFSLHGKRYRLYPLQVPQTQQMLIDFSDETTGKDTYHTGRFLELSYSSPVFGKHPFDPSKAQTFVLNFNRATNPPCAYTPYTHCPIAPKQNHLPVAVLAGEKLYNPVD